MSVHNRRRICDPSAGDGRILSVLNKTHGISKRSLFACEIQDDLVTLLQSKGYKVLERDFLQYNEPIQFDLILANPPFSMGVRHALKMWNCLEPDGEMVILLNWLSISFLEEITEKTINTYQEHLGNLIKQHGRFKRLGQCFRQSERPTDVEVVMIYLRKPKAKHTGPDFDGINVTEDEAAAVDAAFTENALASADMIKSIVAQYQYAVEGLKLRAKGQTMLDFSRRGLPRRIEGATTTEEDNSLIQRVPFDRQVFALKAEFWALIFEKTSVGKRATSDFRKKVETYALENASMSFSEDNIRIVLGVFMSKIGRYMQDAIVRIFDQATAYHKNNTVHYQGWVTNKAWKINDRIIIPDGVIFNNFISDFSAHTTVLDFLRDFDRCLCWISNTDITDPSFFSGAEALSDKCYQANKGEDYKPEFFSTFFRLKMHKTGTLHIDVQDPLLLAEFNRCAAEGKNWIGGKGF